MIGVALLLQTEPLPAASAPVSGPQLTTARALTPETCRPAEDDGDILICGKNDPEQYRLRPLGSPPNGKPLPPMTAKVGNDTVDGRAVEHCAGPVCAPAAMVTLKLPF